jgi:hypothetical protein
VIGQSVKSPELVDRDPRTDLVVESYMTATPQELLDTSIAQLQALSAFLGDQLGVVTPRSDSAPELRACEEILVSLGALILKVQAAAGVRSSRRDRPANFMNLRSGTGRALR